MPHVLLIEDDSAQRGLRALLLEPRGWRVTSAATAAEALTLLDDSRQAPDAVLMDLRLPTPEEGRRLIREIHRRRPSLPVIVLTGSPSALEGAAERPLVREILRKPVRTEALLRTLSRLAALVVPLLVCLPAAAQSRVFPFVLDGAGEAVAELELASPASDWAQPGREAAVASLTVDGHSEQHVPVLAEKDSRRYRVFLGPLAPGRHELAVRRHPELSARESDLMIGDARIRLLEPGTEEEELVRHAPVLFSRQDTDGRFSDVPLIVYATRGRDQAGPWIEYSVIFSNEDGGTSTRDLMARWGRTTDIEFVYRVWPGPGGEPRRTRIQTREHQEAAYDGPYFGLHPLLEPVTGNNMVEPAAGSRGALRFQFAPVLADLSEGSRERMMDAEPFTYEIACKEMQREGKIRGANTWFDGEKIADPRRYFVMEFQTETRSAAVQLLYRLRGESLWRGSALGIGKNFIERGGWVRTAVELPEGRTAAGISEFAFECLSRRDLEKQPVPKDGFCRIARLGRAFSFSARCRPAGAIAVPQPPPDGWRLHVGEMVSFRSE